jgi:acetoin:2,6-dichlorophenolindophenol oxidoreductase subunit beta
MAVLSFAAAINSALDVALGADPDVFLLGEDISDPGGGVYNITKGLSTKYGEHRVRDTPISESAIIGAATGAALAGKRPVAEIMIMDFLGVCLDQLANHAAKLRYMTGGQAHVPLVVRMSAGAGVQFGAQHSELLEAWLVHTPGLKVVMPSTPAAAKGLLLSAIFDDDPVVFIEPTLLYFGGAKEEVPDGDVRIPLGRARIAREGSDVTLISYGLHVHTCLAAAATLHEAGLEAEVIDLQTLEPLDLETVLTSVKKTRRAMVVHEAVGRAGFGAELSALIHEALFDELVEPVRRLTGPNTPVPFAKPLETAFVPTAQAVTTAAKRLSRGKVSSA